MSTKRYIQLFLVALLLLSGSAIGVNRLIDPFWYYRDISIEGLNAVKMKFGKYERHVKPALVQREQPASLIFGSSFAEVGFDPLHPALIRAGKSFNFGLAGASWDMVACHIQFALKNDHALRQIVVGIQPAAMPVKDCSADVGKMENPDERALLFSYAALQASINTIIEQHKHRPSHTAEGLYFYARGNPPHFREYFALFKPCTVKQVAVDPPASRRAGGPVRLDFSGLHELVRKTTEMGVILKLAVLPRHALFFEQEYQCGIRQARWEAIAQILAEVEAAGGKNVEVWDFEGYHAIGTEKISDAPGFYWQDPAHFNIEMGNIMLDEMFGLRRAGLGERLEIGNVPARAAAERKARLEYVRTHPEFLTQLKELLPNRAY